MSSPPPFEWQLYQGNWWLNHNGNWLGYYPASVAPFFPFGIGCQTTWYGEVFDPSPTSWTATNMGSGQYASQGWRQAAYIRQPYYKDLGSVSRWAEGTGAAGDSAGVGTGGVTVSRAIMSRYARKYARPGPTLRQAFPPFRAGMRSDCNGGLPHG